MSGPGSLTRNQPRLDAASAQPPTNALHVPFSSLHPSGVSSFARFRKSWSFEPSVQPWVNLGSGLAPNWPGRV